MEPGRLGRLTGQYVKSQAAVSSMTVFNGTLYAGTENNSNSGPTEGGKVFSLGPTGWSQINTSGFGSAANDRISSLTNYNGQLVAGTRNNAGACQVRAFASGPGIWFPLGIQTFGGNNTDATFMAVFNGNLYMGTDNSSDGCGVWEYTGGLTWNQVNSNGFGNSDSAVTSMTTFNGRLYVGTSNSGGCHVYSYDGSNWSQETLPGSSGFGEPSNIAASSMFGDPTGLYLGTSNGIQSGGPIQYGCEVWRFDGSNWTCIAGRNSLIPIPPKGRGFANQPNDNSNNTAASCITSAELPAGHRIIVGTFGRWNNSTCETQAYDPAANSWIQLGANGMGDVLNEGVASMCIYNSTPVIGTFNEDQTWGYQTGTGAQVLGFGSGTTWNSMEHGGFADSNNWRVSKMAKLGNSVYAGTDSGAGFDIWRYSGGSGWENVASRGLGNSMDARVSAMLADGSNLYVGSFNATAGCALWQYNGSTWTQLVGDSPGVLIGRGFGSVVNQAVSSLAMYGGKLYAGTLNQYPNTGNTGCEVWCFDPAAPGWTQVVGPASPEPGGFGNNSNFQASSMASLGVLLFVGTDNWNNTQGCEVWAYDGTNWTNTGGGGLGNVHNQDASAMTVYNDAVYVGTENYTDGCQLFRYNGTGWDQVNETGFGSTYGAQRITCLTPYPTKLYAGAQNGTNTVFGSEDGNSWTAENAVSNFGNPNVSAITDMAWREEAGDAGPRLYVGTEDLGAGADVYATQVPTIVSVTPVSEIQGKTIDVNIVGMLTHFTEGSSVATFTAAQGITVNSTTVQDATHATANITIAGGATQGARTVNVLTGTEVPVALVNSFTVNYAPAHAWYLAEGSTGPGFETWVLVQNPNDANANVAVTYMTGNGSVTGPTATLPPNSRKTFKVSDTVPNQYYVSTMVTADTRIVVEGSVYGNNRNWGTDSIGVCDPSPSWFLAEGCTGPGFETWILVQNPGSLPASVKLTYMTQSGAVDGPALQIAANSRKSFKVSDTCPGVWEVSTKVESDRPVVAERSMYGNNRSWGTASAGVPQPLKSWFLAEGSTGPGIETWILVQNPGDKVANAKLTFMTDGGSVDGPIVTLQPHTRQTVELAKVVPGRWSVSTKVTSDEPVIAERSMYGNNRKWATESIGAGQAANTWCLAEGCTGPGFETWVLVQNPNDEAAKVTLTYMTAGAIHYGPTVTLAPNSRKTFNVSDVVTDWEVSTLVSSDKPVVAERAMYWNNRIEAHDSIGFPW
jgi:Family of unknown function (DUF5719)